jgi:N-methylhydantoinase A/oxoprolinase/acetone carboxylase beta subunit
MGHQASGRLNFPRRAATTVLKAAAMDEYRKFAGEVTKAVAGRRIQAPVYILKADGGTLPLATSIEHPVETIFSGPAASTMGVLALTPTGQTSVVVDIGGTTTVIA